MLRAVHILNMKKKQVTTIHPMCHKAPICTCIKNVVAWAPQVCSQMAFNWPIHYAGFHSPEQREYMQEQPTSITVCNCVVMPSTYPLTLFIKIHKYEAPPPTFSLPLSAASFTAFTLLTVDDIVNAVRQLPDKFSAVTRCCLQLLLLLCFTMCHKMSLFHC